MHGIGWGKRWVKGNLLGGCKLLISLSEIKNPQVLLFSVTYVSLTNIFILISMLTNHDSVGDNWHLFIEQVS